MKNIAFSNLYGILLLFLTGVFIACEEDPEPPNTAQLIEDVKSFVHLDHYTKVDYSSIIPLIRVYDHIEDPAQKAEAAIILAHYNQHLFDLGKCEYYLKEAVRLNGEAGNWKQQVFAMKDLADLYRLNDTKDQIESLLMEALRICEEKDVSFYVLKPLQELIVHYAYSSEEYTKAILLGERYFKIFEEFETQNIDHPDYDYIRTVDAAIVNLELGHSYVELNQPELARPHLDKAFAFFKAREDHEKLSRIYRHWVTAAILTEDLDSIPELNTKIAYHQQAHYQYSFNRFKQAPEHLRDVENLLLTVELDKKHIASLHQERIYLILLLITTILFSILWFFWMRKAKKSDVKLNEALRNQFETYKNLNEEKSRYFSILSHELRTPIFAITGLTSLLKKSEKVDHSHVDAIVNSGNHLLQLVNNVLQINKLEGSDKLVLNKVVFDLSTILNETVHVISYLAREKKLTLVVEQNLDSPNFVIGDEQKLIQILTNIIFNAIKFSEENGTIKIIVNQRPHDKKSNIYRFGIIDEGVGMSKESIGKIFDYKFHSEDNLNQTQKNSLQGIGIGLYVVSRFLESMDSKILVTSEEGKGSHFYFDLILKNSPAPANSSNNVPIAQTDSTILVVDDNKVNLMVSQKLIHNLDYNCVTATDKDDILDILRTQEIDLILLDLNMPSISGFDLAHKIRENQFLMPIIAHTAIIKEEINGERLMECGIDDILVKPYPSSVLSKKLRKFLALPTELIAK